MNAQLLREWQDRGRFFYEIFPGAATAEDWKRVREKAKQESAAKERDGGSAHEKEALASGTSTVQNPPSRLPA